jgi:hypothetical protein
MGVLLGPNTTVIAQVGFPAEQDGSGPTTRCSVISQGEAGVGGKLVALDRLVTEPTVLTASGTELVPYSTTGGETTDVLMVYMPVGGLLLTAMS